MELARAVVLSLSAWDSPASRPASKASQHNLGDEDKTTTHRKEEDHLDDHRGIHTVASDQCQQSNKRRQHSGDEQKNGKELAPRYFLDKNG